MTSPDVRVVPAWQARELQLDALCEFTVMLETRRLPKLTDADAERWWPLAMGLPCPAR